jgi:hypothetical protein
MQLRKKQKNTKQTSSDWGIEVVRLQASQPRHRIQKRKMAGSILGSGQQD